VRLALWIFFAGVLLFGVGAMVWIAADLPPLRLVLSHGFPPAGGPTGREKEIEGVRFVEIGTGYFRMGSWFLCAKGDALGRICKVFHLPWGKQPQEKGDEVPVRWVEIREPYWVAVTELTNAQYARFDPEHERSKYSPDDDSPVVDVSFEEAKAYCGWLSKRSGLRARLASEAEWENACRAGSRTEYCFGDDEAKLGEYAWFDSNSGGPAHAVGTKRPNAWGLYDLHGNVWEWCEDRWHDDYEGAPEDARPWTDGASPDRVRRGGSWLSPAVFCRSAGRDWLSPSVRYSGLGFRPCLGPLDP
jgi:formylglycine-generating enzyme required for sulfatase activity